MLMSSKDDSHSPPKAEITFVAQCEKSLVVVLMYNLL